MMIWLARHHGFNPEMLGFIPEFLSENDPRPAAKQIDSHYGHGGGWRPLSGFKLTARGLEYPGDPPLELLASTVLRDEIILFFEAEILAIVQPDGSLEAARLD